MKIREFRYFSCDYETTVYEDQDFTEVWLAGFTELFSNDEPFITGNIHTFFQKVFSLRGNVCLYFHNLKFDGSFIVDYLLRRGFEFHRTDENKMKNNEFKCSISQMGQWYNIIIKRHGKIIELRDSLKLLPFSLERIGHSFGTKHKKLSMEYKGYRYANCPVSEEEKEYFISDLYVLREALEIMFNEGHDSITIGSCCLKEFKSFYDKEDYNNLFPNLYEVAIPEEIYGYPNAGEYVRASYRGGVCILKKGMENVIHENGDTYDVNSLYPSEMHSESGNYYPVGLPKFWRGNIPYEELDNKEWFVRFECRFELKQGYLPTVQIKRNLRYKGNEYLETSDIYYNGKHHRYYRDDSGNLKEARVTMTMTRMDFERFNKHYNVIDLKVLDGCIFYREIGLFDEYIDKYKEIKIVETGAKRELAKLYLNNLYGKEASSTDSSYKIPFLNEEKDCVSFELVEENEKQPGYIPIGSYITSYARNFTLEACQLNYDNFIYCDTDSLHMLDNGKVVGIKLDDVQFCCWKHECHWDKAIFVRQKTYIEHVTHENDKPVEPHYDIKCAGMPKKCKEEFLKNYEMEDFKIGLRLNGKLRPKRMKGGIVLVDTTYEMK